MSTDEEDFFKKEMEEMKVRLFIANSKLRKANSSGGVDTTQLSSDIGGTGSTLTDKINDIKSGLGVNSSNLVTDLYTLNEKIGTSQTIMNSRLDELLDRFSNSHPTSISDCFDLLNSYLMEQLVDTTPGDFEFVSYDGLIEHTFNSASISDASSVPQIGIKIGTDNFILDGIIINNDNTTLSTPITQNQILNFKNGEISSFKIKYIGSTTLTNVFDSLQKFDIFLKKNIGDSDYKYATLYPRQIDTKIEHIRKLINSNSTNTQSLKYCLELSIDLIDNGILKLPNINSPNIITSSFSSGVSQVTVSIDNESYTFSGSLVSNNDKITFISGSKTLIFLNKSGGNLSSVSDIQKYLNSKYPISKKLGGSIYTQIQDIMTMVGGTQTSLKDKITSIDGKILNTPTGILTNDLSTARSKISILDTNLEDQIDKISEEFSNTADNLETKVNNLKTDLGGTGTTLTDKISNVKTKLGSSGTVLDRIDDIADSITYQLVDTNSSDFEFVSYNGQNEYQFKDPIFNHPLPQNLLILIEGDNYTLQKNIDSNSGSFIQPIQQDDEITFTFETYSLILKYKSSAQINDVNTFKALLEDFLKSSQNVYAKLYKTSIEDRLNSLKKLADNNFTPSTLHYILTEIKKKIDSEEIKISSNINSFRITSQFSVSGNQIYVDLNINESSTGTFLFEYTSNIKTGSTITFTSSNMIVEFVNKSTSQLTNISEVATYLNSAHPLYKFYSRDIKSNIDDMSDRLENSADSMSAKLESIRKLILNTPSRFLKQDVQEILNLISPNYTSIENAIVAISNRIGDSGTIVERVNKLANNLTTSQNPLNVEIGIAKNNIDNNIVSLPGGATYFQIKSITKTNTIFSFNLTFEENTDLNGIYTINMDNNQIYVGDNFNLTGSGGNVTLKNVSGFSLTGSNFLSYVTSMYPINVNFYNQVLDNISEIRKMISNDSTSLRSRIASFDRNLLKNPTGVLNNDLTKLRIFIISSRNSDVETDISNIRNLICDDINFSSSPLDTLIGNPMINNSQSPIVNVIGGFDPAGSISIADLLGDPSAGDKGLSQIIKGSTQEVTNGNIDAGLLTSLNEASNLKAQLDAILNILRGGIKIPANNYISIYEAISSAVEPST